MKQIVMTSDLDNNPEAIETYKKFHSDEHVWPEVQQAAKESGFESIKIYLLGTRLVMILRYPSHLNIDDINKKYRDSNPETMDKWSSFMGGLLNAPPAVDSSLIWAEMENVYFFEKEADQ